MMILSGINAADPSWYFVELTYTDSTCSNSTLVAAESEYFKFSQMYSTMVSILAGAGQNVIPAGGIGVCGPVSYLSATAYGVMSNECTMQVYTDAMCLSPVGAPVEMWTGACEVDTDAPDASSGIAPGTTLYKRNYCTNVAPTTLATYTDLTIANAFIGQLYPSAPVTPPVAEKKDDVCFTAESTVEKEDGTMVALKDVKIGDRVLTLKDGAAVFSDVVAVPHQQGAGAEDVREATVLAISVGRDVTVEATASHLIAVAEADDCDSLGAEAFTQSASLVEAHEVARGTCVAVRTGDGFSSAAVTDIRSVTRNTSLLSVVTLNGGYPFVNGIAASSFALNHFFPTAFYNMHRLLFSIGLKEMLDSGFVRGTTEAFGHVAVNVHRAIF